MKNERPRILAIDDNPENLIVIGTSLEADYDIQVASSGLEGLALARQTPPDLILLDVMMPGLDGFETCRLFKADAALENIPVIFLTAVSDMHSEVSGLELGAADYLTKPIKVALLKQRTRNILQLTRLTRDLRASEERLRLVMEATGEGVWDWNILAGGVGHNASWCQILGLDAMYLEHEFGQFTDLIHPDDLPQVKQRLSACLEGSGEYESEHRLRHADGHYVWVLDRGKVVHSDGTGTPLRMVGSIRNIDDRKRYDAEIHRLAFYDPLTGLPNRRLLMDRLQQAIMMNERHTQIGALMYIDMDRFKALNDTHGHAMGDRLLIQVGERLRSAVRGHDTVARLGGDEFVLMLERLSSSRDEALARATAIARKVLEVLNTPYDLGEVLYMSTPSIGVTLVLDRNETIDEVLQRADMAMYDAKAAGRNTVRTCSRAA
ncbi:diguanylate cyclase [Zoogloea sp.]|uniref:diguanylate cyclase domain-containing protein n=1 Tax=Zoogloea sp. TaxID=49181 RepID=UPI001415BCCB|nr:MAG: diguanylate cyclase [Zoogloea sp.]